MPRARPCACAPRAYWVKKILGTGDLCGEHVGGNDAEVAVGNQFLVPERDDPIRFGSPLPRVGIDLGCGLKGCFGLAYHFIAPSTAQVTNRVVLAVIVDLDSGLERRISGSLALALYRFAGLAEGVGKLEQREPPPGSAIGFVDDRDVVGRREQTMARREGHVLLVDVPGGDHAHIHDLLQRRDIDRSTFGQLLGDQQSLAPERRAFLGVLGAFRGLKQLRARHRCVVAERWHQPICGQCRFPFSPPPWTMAMTPPGVGCPVIACPIRTCNHDRSGSGSACNAFSQSGWVNSGAVATSGDLGHQERWV
jgi:hypothetical protein